MKSDIILSGVGGQGILSIAAVIGHAAVKKGLHIKQAEVHGMSQRGGDVQSNLRISDKIIYSDLIQVGKADVIISLEPMESLRYLKYLSPNGWLVTSSAAFVNIPNYPKTEDLMSKIDSLCHKVVLDIDLIAKELGSVRSANIVMLGAASPFIGIDYEDIKEAVKAIFASKGDAVVDINLKALEAGRNIATSIPML